MDTLQNVDQVPRYSPRIRDEALPQELAILATYMEPHSHRIDQLRKERLLMGSKARNQAHFWDIMGLEVISNKSSPTVFLSEQNAFVYSAARYEWLPNSKNQGVDKIYLNHEEFLLTLRVTALGTSSVYHTWDPIQERFIYAKSSEGIQGYLVIDGADEVICQSISQRFLTIGTLMRRLEVLLHTLRAGSSQVPTIHAFAHSLSTILIYLREDITYCFAHNIGTDCALSAFWMQFAIHEEILIVLSSFYGRTENTTPDQYPSLDHDPVPLLNRIHDELAMHIERHSSRLIISLFAFILTNTCHDYLREISQSIGYGVVQIKKSTYVVGERPDQYALDEIEGERPVDDVYSAIDQLSTDFPSFFPNELLEVLPAAQKSLILLQAAQPEHPLLVAPEGQDPIRWFWTSQEIEAAWHRTHQEEEVSEPPSRIESPTECHSSVTYKPELLQFRIFDQDPSYYDGQSAMKTENNSVTVLKTFITKFPGQLPPITPTLPLLASLVFSKLVEHASKLSNALLSVFLSSDGNLNLRAHLELLRSFLLVTSPAFESRLSSALFSDAEEYHLDIKSGTSLYALRRRSSKKVSPGSRPWAVGLASDLLEKDVWPPVDADLGFFLRTVIVDSIENNVGGDEGAKVCEEAEYRLGFAIRDLPIGSGKERWLNPLGMALDFLYMDYKPPHSLQVLITSDVLSKYQRMFSFILRLMRVTYAIKAIFRMTLPSPKPLFETLVQSRKLMLHFRFVAHSFISNLSAYVFDTAIGGNFDPFIGRLTVTVAATSSSAPVSRPATPTSTRFGLLSEPGSERFTDVFMLSKHHSDLLDNILSACLLRSGQREVGDILRQSLEIVLEFAVLMGELHRGRLKEYQAAPALEDLFQRFRVKTKTLTRVLKELAEKTGANTAIRASMPMDPMDTGRTTIMRPTGGMEALSHLLMRLDLSDWWTGLGSKRKNERVKAENYGH
ncbi:hypothetical protein AMATHDRAFT_187068 [Amanita thiersii Skay4041]|uniref:Spindle pole body component n=1 Tax=Amanita thiersii Skay4041 TaxID=703135 RepID=A0A2A9NRV9_9AGAR|nr:hypothetical protein AMATHDRAFT_187068 [Amanita thiersii Skay4041]